VLLWVPIFVKNIDAENRFILLVIHPSLSTCVSAILLPHFPGRHGLLLSSFGDSETICVGVCVNFCNAIVMTIGTVVS